MLCFRMLFKSVGFAWVLQGVFPALILGRSVIFIHTDGAGIAQWQMARFVLKGADGDLNWDRLDHVGVYRGHLADQLTATSNAGAVAHATGTRLHAKSFGLELESGLPPQTASGRRETIMQEAIRRGVKTALINSGDITEPGTAAFVAAVARREDHDAIALQVCESGVNVILSGGEAFLLPKGKKGRHGIGRREDGRDLVVEMQRRGYRIVYTREELSKVHPGTSKLLGVFASGHTFHDDPMDVHERTGKPLYIESAPTVGEMTAKALELLGDDPFLMVVEEEGCDNFGNLNHAPGVLESLRRADEAHGVAIAFVEKNPKTLLLTAADSEAGAMDVLGFSENLGKFIEVAQNGRDSNGAPYGLDWGGKPFLSAPDRHGKRLPFVVTWGTRHDTCGGILVRALGHGAERVRGAVQNTDIYRIIREGLWGGDEEEAPVKSVLDNPK
jgi:alkaline phosphatase